MSHTIPSRKRQHAQSGIANSFASTKPTSLSLQPRLVVHLPCQLHHQLVKCSACQGLYQKRKFQPKMAYQTQATSAPAQSASPSSVKSLLTSFRLVLTPILLQRICQSLASCRIIRDMESHYEWKGWVVEGWWVELPDSGRATMQGGRCLNEASSFILEGCKWRKQELRKKISAR